MKATSAPLLRACLEGAIDREIRKYERCRRLLRYVDATVLGAGIEAFSSTDDLVLWLCAPATALRDQTPLQALRTASGRRKVANILRAIVAGVYL